MLYNPVKSPKGPRPAALDLPWLHLQGRAEAPKLCCRAWNGTCKWRLCQHLCLSINASACLQELEDILDDDQDMADMYVPRLSYAAQVYRPAGMGLTLSLD